MAADTLIDRSRLEAGLFATANAIRAKTGELARIPWDWENQTGFAAAVSAIPQQTATPAPVGGEGIGGEDAEAIYEWNFALSLTERLTGLEAVLCGARRNSSGARLDGPSQALLLPGILQRDRTYELDIPWFSYGGSDTADCILLSFGGTQELNGLRYRRANAEWRFYIEELSETIHASLGAVNCFSRKKLGLYVDAAGYPYLYLDGENLGRASVALPEGAQDLAVGSTLPAANGAQCYDLTVRSLTVFDGNRYAVSNSPTGKISLNDVHILPVTFTQGVNALTAGTEDRVWNRIYGTP